MKIVSLYRTLPPIARSEIDAFTTQIRPMGWAERSQALIGLWHAVHAHHRTNAAMMPADHSPAAEWRGRMTAVLERLRVTAPFNAHTAAWMAVALHECWSDLGARWMAENPAQMADWNPRHEISTTKFSTPSSCTSALGARSLKRRMRLFIDGGAKCFRRTKSVSRSR